MNILGIDPGSRNCGYSIISCENSKMKLLDAGFIKIKSRDFAEQISELLEGLSSILSSVTIDEVAIEDMFVGKNPRGSLKLAQFRGAIIVKVMEEVGDFYEYTPLEVKKSVTGNGKSDKHQVAFMIKKLLNIKGDIKPLDITDAIAISITHFQQRKMKILEKSKRKL